MKSKLVRWYNSHNNAVDTVVEIVADLILGTGVVKGALTLGKSVIDDKGEDADDRRVQELENIIAILKPLITDLVDDIEDLKAFKEATTEKEARLAIENSYVQKELNKIMPQLSESITQSMKILSKKQRFSKNDAMKECTVALKLQQFFKGLPNENNIIKDNSTGVEWIVGKDEDITWDNADAWVKNLNAMHFAGGNWKLPTISQLKEIYKEGNGEHNLDSVFGSFSILWLRVWSEELVDVNGGDCGKFMESSCARCFHFYYGDDLLGDREDYNMRVFSVRAG